MSRRNFIKGITAASLFAGTLPAFADISVATVPKPSETDKAINGAPLFPIGALAANRVAQAFASAPQLSGPFLFDLVNDEGQQDFSDLKGKIRLVSLWAENFWPCLHELNELAELQSLYGNDSFEIMAILTQSRGRLDYAAARALMNRTQAENLRLWVEPNGRNQVATALAMMIGPYPQEHPAKISGLTTIMPCTLIMDAEGRIRGRCLGGRGFIKKRAVRTRWQTPLPVELTGVAITRNPTMWSDQDADPFILALKGGALDKLSNQI